MKKPCIALLLTLAASTAFAAKNCEELKAEIDAKLQAKGVANYTLTIVPSDAPEDGKVVGTCGGGTQKIVYKKN